MSIKNIDKGLLEAASKILNEGKEVLNEGANDHEEIHKTILKKLHKEVPELALNKATHSDKRTNRDGSETHTYTIKHDVPPTFKHTIKHHATHVEITHTKHEGKPFIHAQVHQRWEHTDGGTNGHTIGNLSHDHPNHPGKTHYRPNGGAAKEV